MRNWFNVKAQADIGVEVSIYDEIGGWGVTAKEFIDSIKPFKGKPMALAINSPGGDVFAGIAIYNALRMHGADVTVTVMGVAASAASVIAMAGTKIVMPENTFLMIHNPWTFAMGNADELRDMADVLDKIGSSLVSTYVARTGKSEDDIKAMLADETWLTAAEAVEAGFADEVQANLKVAAKFELDRLPDNVRAALAFEPAPTATVVPPRAAALAEQIKAAADQRGLGDFADAWVLDPAIESIDALLPRLVAADEIVSACGYANQQALAVGFIKANASVKDVRTKLFAMAAEADESTVIDTAPKGTVVEPTQPAKATISYRSVYANL